MARGWESKSVEAQMEAAVTAHVAVAVEGIDLKRAAAMREKENLILSRRRVLHELETAQNPRYQQILRRGLADLDRKLALIG